jgi:1-pyrroline-5-carboxylate dehydrogenase
MEKVTYASLAALGEEFHTSFDRAVAEVRRKSGQTRSFYIGGKPQNKRENFDDESPSNTNELLGRFPVGQDVDVRMAITAARKAFPMWRDLGWQKRIRFIRRAAEIITQRQIELAAILVLEAGKNRTEAIAEVSEAADLLLYYSEQMEKQQGYEVPLVTDGNEHTCSALKPYGVWAVISPFNFPFALAAGMAAGALIAGNTVVFKPATDTPWSGLSLYEILKEAGLPDGAFNFVTGSGKDLGDALISNANLDGFAFTGSKEVGLHILQQFRKHVLRPVIAEMGGKNPAIIMPSANLEDASEGVLRSAFGMGGQKCSACSRLYVHQDIYQQFLGMLVEKTKRLKIGDPTLRNTFLGPLISETARKRYRKAVQIAEREGRIILGGNTLTENEFAMGYFVEPTIVDRLPAKSKMFQDEFFAPVLAVAKVNSLVEAIEFSNNAEYGLTAGIFTEDDKERECFFKSIEAGVTYCNRRGGATTGAWPGVQSFGGWKASGSTGKNALGPYYVAQFMREQSQTVCKNLPRQKSKHA